MPTFIMMCGPSGCGKSTVAQAYAKQPNTVILSSDKIRGELYGDETIQDNPAQVFEIMRQRTHEALNNGQSVVYDATNLNSRKRITLLNELKRRHPDVRTELGIVATDPRICIENQYKRSRNVPEYVVEKQVKSFQMPTLQEKWDAVYVINLFYDKNLMPQILEDMRGFDQSSSWHTEKLDNHNALLVSYSKEHGFSPLVKEAAEVHDIGKLFTREYDENGEAHFFGHAQYGAYLWLCANVETGILSPHDLAIASLINTHMDMYNNPNHEKLKANLGEETYQALLQLHEADDVSCVREAWVNDMSPQTFMNTYTDWEARISQPPFGVKVSHDHDMVLLKYNMLTSDMSIPLVQQCRGVILASDEQGKWQYVCRPFDKFFNHGETDKEADIDWTTARVTEKVDGSLCKIFYHDNQWRLATNGTIDALKAQVADTSMTFGSIFNRAIGMPFDQMAEQYHFDKSKTYMFELTSPDTKLVIDYPDAVWYLAARDTQTGKEDFSLPALPPSIHFPKQYPLRTLNDVVAAVSKMDKTEEGVVVNDASGNRIKVKSAEYLIAAKLLNNKMVSNRNLLMYFLNGQLDDFLAYCPNYKQRADAIVQAYQAKAKEYMDEWMKYKDQPDMPRPEFVQLVKDSPAKDFIFSMKDGKVESVDEWMNGRTIPYLMKLLHLKEEPNINNEDMDIGD